MTDPDLETSEPDEQDDESETTGDFLARATGVGSSMKQALMVPALALLSALIIGAIIMAVTDVDSLRLWGDDPGEAFSSTLRGIGSAYKALFVGSLGSRRAITETLFAATPLILAGLAVAVGFQAGLFNIGANGQMHVGGMIGLWVGFGVSAPAIIHIPLAILGAVLGGALWGGLAGLLKARTGAHEVITTIMLNFIALFMVDYLLTGSFFQAEGRNDPISRRADESAQFPTLFGDFRVHIGFLVALGAVWLVWWLMYRSTIGYEFRAVGANPDGGKYAGMNVAWVYVAVMGVSGALAGAAGANQVLGLEPYRAFSNFAGDTGFDAIALALLGRSHPVGVLFAGLLFGGLRAGGIQMQGAAGIPVDLVLVLQALIIVFIAAPELVKAVYRIKTVDDTKSSSISTGWGS
ncbi:MAG: ABC transporter permease [Acidimicrobiia bacterium]|nr:ABC transporter permease [Acidimicrobiia bacterium]